MANEHYISAGLVPEDNSSGATANTHYIAAGLVPDDVAAGGAEKTLTGAMPAQSGAIVRQINVSRPISGAI